MTPAVSDTQEDSGRKRRRRRRHRRHRVEPHRAERWVLWLQCAVVIGSLMAIGTVHVPVLVAVACAALALPVMVLVFGLEADNVRLFVPPAIVLLLLSAYSLLQAVPMPMSWLRVLSPGVADIWSRCLLPFGQPGPKLVSLSADPGASMREGLKWIAYAAVFGSAAVLAARRGLRWAVTLVYGAAVLAALTTIAHGLVGAEKVFGLYEPQYAHLHWAIGPLLNPNNLAGYLNVGALCGFGLMLDRDCPVPRWLVAFGIATLVGTSVVCASRAGVVALPAGVFVFWLLARKNRRVQRSGTARRLWWVSVAAVFGGLVLAIFGSSTDTWNALFDNSLEKLSMVAWAGPLVKKHPWFGIGRGASESVFAAFRQAPGHTVFTHIENFAMEWTAEWGLPVAILALLAFGWYLRPTRLGVRNSVLAAGAVAASVTLLGQNLFDLGLEVPAVCIALATLLGAAYGAAPDQVAESKADRKATAPVAPGRGWLPLAAPLALTALVGTVSWGWHTDLSDRVDLHDAYGVVKASDATSTSAFFSMLRLAMLRHPAEPYFPLLGGLVAWSSQHNALPWLSRSLERDPMNGRTHLAAAYVVASRGRLVQALFELRLAVADDRSLKGVVARTATRWTHDRARLMSLIPDDPSDAAILLTDMAQYLRDPDDAELRTSLLEAASKHDPDNVQGRVEWASDIIRALIANAPSCQGARRATCQQQVLTQIGQIATLDPAGSDAIDLRAQLLMAFGRPSEAVALMTVECPKRQDRSRCGRVWLKAAVAAGDGKATSEAVETLTRGCHNAAICVSNYDFAGDVLMVSGLPGLALENYEQAATSDGTAARWVKVANAASQSGSHTKALQALEHAQQVGGLTPDIQRRIARERRSMTQTLVGVGSD